MAYSRKVNRSVQKITDAQLVVLRHFRDYYDLNEIAPSLAILAKTLNISRPSVSTHLARLTAHGCLKLTDARYRPWLLTSVGRRLADAVPQAPEVSSKIPPHSVTA